MYGLESDADYYSLKTDREYHIISGFHGSKKAMGFIRDKVEKDLRVQEDWLFLIEGSDAAIKYGLSCDEVGYAHLLAERKKISIEDPVIDPTRLEIIEIALSQGTNRNLIYLSILDVCGGSPEMFFYKYGIGGLSFMQYAMALSSATEEQKRTVLHPVFDNLSKISTQESEKLLRYAYARNTVSRRRYILVTVRQEMLGGDYSYSKIQEIDRFVKEGSLFLKIKPTAPETFRELQVIEEALDDPSFSFSEKLLLTTSALTIFLHLQGQLGISEWKLPSALDGRLKNEKLERYINRDPYHLLPLLPDLKAFDQFLETKEGRETFTRAIRSSVWITEILGIAGPPGTNSETPLEYKNIKKAILENLLNEDPRIASSILQFLVSH